MPSWLRSAPRTRAHASPGCLRCRRSSLGISSRLAGRRSEKGRAMIGPVRVSPERARDKRRAQSRRPSGLDWHQAASASPDAVIRRRARNRRPSSSADSTRSHLPVRFIFYRCRAPLSRTRSRIRTVTRRLQSILSDYSNVTILLWDAAVRNRSVTLTIPKPPRRTTGPKAEHAGLAGKPKRAPEGARASAPDGPWSLRRRAPSPVRRGGRSCGWRCSCARRPWRRCA